MTGREEDNKNQELWCFLRHNLSENGGKAKVKNYVIYEFEI